MLSSQYRWILLLLLLTVINSRLVVANPEDAEPKRVLHFVLRMITPESANWIAEQAKKAGFNTIQVQITDGVRLENAVWEPLPDAWSKKEFVSWVNAVQAQGLEIVPELKLLTHQDKFLQKRYPWLMYNIKTYDPRNKGVYQYALPLIDEVISIVQPIAFHIGHDELAGHSESSRKKWLKQCDEMLPAELFLNDVLMLHDYLKSKNIETWMWGDMLISPDEFPGMLDKHLHGTALGYGKELRSKLPRDIVITDWHYFDSQKDFPSLSVMQSEGFRVIGSTWKIDATTRNFSHYASHHAAYGMMATTWFHVQRKEWDIVDTIITASGEIFQTDFPDAR